MTAPLVGAQGGHKARLYSANDALTKYAVVQIPYRIYAMDHYAISFPFSLRVEAEHQDCYGVSRELLRAEP